MGFWDSIGTFGSKLVSGAASFADKGWGEVNAIGQKVSDIAHTVVDNKIVSGLLASNPEIDRMVRGGLAVGDGVLGVSKVAEQEAKRLMGGSQNTDSRPANDRRPIQNINSGGIVSDRKYRGNDRRPIQNDGPFVGGGGETNIALGSSYSGIQKPPPKPPKHQISHKTPHGKINAPNTPSEEAPRHRKQHAPRYFM